MQLPAPAKEYFPAGQLLHTEPGVENFPAEHGKQLVLVSSLFVVFPASQGVQAFGAP